MGYKLTTSILMSLERIPDFVNVFLILRFQKGLIFFVSLYNY